MLELIAIWGLPAVTLLLARHKKGRSPAVFVLAEYLIYVCLLFAAEMALFMPLGRIKVRWTTYGYTLPQITYGTAALLASAVMAAVLGFVMPRIKARLGIRGEIAPAQKATPGRRAVRALCALLLLGLVLLTLCFFWAQANYGNVSLEKIVFHIHMPLEGTDEFMSSIMRDAVVPSLLLFSLLAAVLYAPVRRAWWVRAEALPRFKLCILPLRLPRAAAIAGGLLWVACLYIAADNYFDISKYLINQVRQSFFIEEYYVDPAKVEITFPEKKRNLITIYVESAETSSQNKANGGFFDVNYIPEMTRIAKENVSFSHSNKLEGAAVAPSCGWTIAGLTAETAGLPLKLHAQGRGKGGVDNSMSKYDTFMPGATTLGDILKAQGYTNMFMCGSEFEFGGRQMYFTLHGDYIVRDWHWAVETGKLPKDYWVNWGFEDEKLYPWAKEELTALAEAGEPFHFSLLTVDTHAPNGYVCPQCTDTYDEQYANVLACSSRQLDAFVSWCMEQPFYENTSIVIVGDHSSMQANFYEEGEPDTHSGNENRKVYNAFINCAAEPVKEEFRQFTTFDFFPSMLAALGVTIEGDRLGLGTNLFSSRETIAEEVGYEKMFDELSRKSRFYNEEIFFPK